MNSYKEAGAGGGGGIKEEDTTWIRLGQFTSCNPIPKFCCLVNHRGRLIQSDPIQVASIVPAFFKAREEISTTHVPLAQPVME